MSNPKIPVSVGELIDKLTILNIKRDKGLDVEKEYDLLEQVFLDLELPIAVDHLTAVLKTINSQLWVIEDTKRGCEEEGDFGSGFIDYARLVYMLNDERARIKKCIDALSESDISEVKSH